MTGGPPNILLPTTLVGSYPPDWLIDRRLLADIVPPNMRSIVVLALGCENRSYRF